MNPPAQQPRTAAVIKGQIRTADSPAEGLMMPQCDSLCRLENNGYLVMRCVLSLSVLVASTIPMLPVRANPTGQPRACSETQTGTYLIVSEGQRAGQPVGRLQLENWAADGSVSGSRFLRLGKTYSETRYSGRWERLSGCALSVMRDSDGSPSNVLLTPQGLPRFGISTRPGDVVTERWIQQPSGRCTPGGMNGTVLSLQRGQSFSRDEWTSNVVIQQETWNDWNMVGLAVSSYAGAGEVAAYQGRFTQDDNCIGRIRQQDARGVTYSYVAILRSDGGGYAYLQTQGDDLTVALLDRVSAGSGP